MVNTINSFVLFTVLLAIILAVYNWHSNRNVVYLSVFLIGISIITLTLHMTIAGGSVVLYAILLNNFAPFYYLAIPMFYFFVRGIVSDNKTISKKDFFHFIPFIIHCIGIFPYWLLSFNTKLDIAQRILHNPYIYEDVEFCWLYPHIINLIARPVLLLGYLIASVVLLYSFYLDFKNMEKKIKQSVKRTSSFISIFLVIVFVLLVLNLYIGFQFMINTDIKVIYSKIHIFVHLIIYIYLLLPVFILFYPKILYGVSNIAMRLPVKNEAVKINENKAVVSEKDIEIANEILIYLKEHKPYLDVDFSLHNLCAGINKPRHQIQYCLANILHTNFIQLKNKLRIEYAIELLKSDSVKNTTIEGIGKQSGFKSNSNFYVCFKEITGYKPNEWLEKNRL